MGLAQYSWNIPHFFHTCGFDSASHLELDSYMPKELIIFMSLENATPWYTTVSIWYEGRMSILYCLYALSRRCRVIFVTYIVRPSLVAGGS